jgi:hypothetical protein
MQEIYNQGKKHGAPHIIKDSEFHAEPYIILQDNERCESLVELLPNPIRKTGHYYFNDLADLIKYVKVHSFEETPVTWWVTRRFGCDRVCVILDDNGANAGWRQYVCWGWTANVTDHDIECYDGIPPVKPSRSHMIPVKVLRNSFVTKPITTPTQIKWKIIKMVSSSLFRSLHSRYNKLRLRLIQRR